MVNSSCNYKSIPHEKLMNRTTRANLTEDEIQTIWNNFYWFQKSSENLISRALWRTGRQDTERGFSRFRVRSIGTDRSARKVSWAKNENEVVYFSSHPSLSVACIRYIQLVRPLVSDSLQGIMPFPDVESIRKLKKLKTKRMYAFQAIPGCSADLNKVIDFFLVKKLVFMINPWHY